MAVSIVRPDALISGSFTVTGAANAFVALNDNSDASFIRKTGTGTASTILNFADITLGASQTVRQVRVRARIQTPSSAGKLNIQLGTRVNGVNYFTSALAIRGAVATGEVTGQWYSTAPDGGAWTQAKITALRAQLTEYRDSTDRAFIYELYIDVDVANQATVTVITPTGTITTTAKPDVTWSVTDPDGDFASYYEVKIFNSTTYNAAGFDPLTAEATWTSNQVTGTDVSTTVGAFLTNGAFRAYVRVAKSINGTAFWSGLAFSAFTVSLTPPTVPTLGLVYTSGQNKVAITVTGASAAAFTSQTFEVQRSNDGGTTWISVRYAVNLIPSSLFIALVSDHEAARGQTVGYRVRSVGVSGTNVQASNFSATSNVTTVNDGTWLLKTLEPDARFATDVNILAPDSWEIPEQIGTFRPLGRKFPVIVAAAINSDTGSYNVVTTNTAQYTALAPLIAYQGMLLVVSPYADQKYVRIISRSVTRTGTKDRPRYEYTLGYVEISG